MPHLNIPHNINTNIEAHRKWLRIVQEAQTLVEDDSDLQYKAAKGLRIKERHLPVEVLGRMYAQYCDLINKMYDAYLNNVQVQKAAYMKEIICIFMKRLYELRNELVHLIVNDYIYVDTAITQLRLTPANIQIVVPYHFPLECRTDTMERLLQRMWTDAVRRKNAPPKKEKPQQSPMKSTMFGDDDEELTMTLLVNEEQPVSNEETVEEESVHTIIPEECTQVTIIQKHERYRQYFIADFKVRSRKRKAFAVQKSVPAPKRLRVLAAKLIQKVYREFMRLKRKKILDLKRDIILGLIPDPFKKRLNFEEENNKIYERRKNIRKELNKYYLEQCERENSRLLFFKRNNQIDDITEEVREWFKEWYYGYGFFPDFPFELEGGTLLVIRGDYPTIEEKIEQDERYLAATKGKTKEQLKNEKEQAKLEAEMKAELEREQKKKEAEQMFKMRCNPFSDPGYQIKKSENIGRLIEALQKYRAAWSIYDQYPTDKCAETVYGYMEPLITEDLMSDMHKDCRMYVDELMRLDLKLLIKSHQMMYKMIGKKYPKLKMRRPPNPPSELKTIIINDNLLKNLEVVFDLGLVTKPTAKLKDIYGDSNYAAYELNIQDPNAMFPSPGYGDIKRRLILSCIFGIGIEPGAKRNKTVLLLGPERNGKSFLVDTVCGELNAVKIDISPEVFSAKLPKPKKILMQVIAAAKTFQPTVIFLKNIEKVFCKKVLPQDRKLKAKSLKKPLTKMLKALNLEDKIMFIATCSNPFEAKAKPLTSLFSEIILVPRTDYGSLQSFLYEKLQSIRSMDRDYCVQALAHLLQDYGFGFIIKMFDNVMNAERIVKLNVSPLSPSEFLFPLIESEIEPITLQDYEKYTDFFIKFSSLKTEREEYDVINLQRARAYEKLAKKDEETD